MSTPVQQYLTKETIASLICNALLNLGPAYAIFHARPLVPTGGPTGLVRDLIGETFLAAGLSSMVPALIARHRRRAGTLPRPETTPTHKEHNPYLVAVLVGLVFTCVLMPLNAWLLPMKFPAGVRMFDVVLYKTLYGTVVGGLATFITLRRALTVTQQAS